MMNHVMAEGAESKAPARRRVFRFDCIRRAPAPRRTMRILLSGVPLCLLLLTAQSAWAQQSGAGADQQIVVRAIRELEAVPQWEKGWTGRPSDPVLTLLYARFSASRGIMDAIDRAEAQDKTELTEVLYRIVGCCKDPTTIPWLQVKLAGPQRAHVFKYWLSGWSYGTMTRCLAVNWMEHPEEWIEFLVALFENCPEPNVRARFAHYLRWWPRDPRVLAYAEERFAHDPVPLVRLKAAGHLLQCGVPVNEAEFRRLFGTLSCQKEHDDELLWVGVRAPDVAIPWLIERLRAAPDEQERARALAGLRWVTFARNIVEPEDWERWYARHRAQTRDEWVREAAAELDGLLQEDVAAWRRAVADNWPRFLEPALIPYINRWSLRADLHTELLDRINEREFVYENECLLRPALMRFLAGDPAVAARARRLLCDCSPVAGGAGPGWEECLRATLQEFLSSAIPTGEELRR